MKNLILIVALFFAANTATFAQKPKSENITIKTNIYCDHCMECGSCGGRINMSLQKHPGIKTVDINPEENTISIKYNPRKISPEKLRDILNEAGFDADDQKAPASAVAKLDGCCKAK